MSPQPSSSNGKVRERDPSESSSGDRNDEAGTQQTGPYREQATALLTAARDTQAGEQAGSTSPPPSAAKGGSWMGSSQPSSSLQGQGHKERSSTERRQIPWFSASSPTVSAKNSGPKSFNYSKSEKSLQEMIQPPPSLPAGPLGHPSAP